MSDDYDKQKWQAEQAARDAAIEKQRDKERKARERSARNAKRKLERLHRTLKENGEITDWEDEFSESVTERLDKFGSAFHDLEKGRPGDALSFSQKRVVSALNKKVKDAKKAKRERELKGEDEDDFDEPRRTSFKPRSSFKSKGKPKFTPRVRHIEDDFVEPEPPRPKPAPFIPEFVKDKPAKPALSAMPKPKSLPALKAVTEGSAKSTKDAIPSPAERAGKTAKPRPSFLRLVKNDEDD